MEKRHKTIEANDTWQQTKDNNWDKTRNTRQKTIDTTTRDKTKDKRLKTKDIWHKTRNNWHKTWIMYKIRFLRQHIEDRRPWTHLTKDTWDKDSEEKTILKKKLTKDDWKKQWTRIYMLTKTVKIDNKYNPIDNRHDNAQWQKCTIQTKIRHKTQDWQKIEIINLTLFFSYTMVNLCMCLSFNFEYQIKQKSEQCSVIPTTLLGCLLWKGKSLSLLMGLLLYEKNGSISFKGLMVLSSWQRYVHLCHQGTTNGYFLRICSMFKIDYSSGNRWLVNCVSFKGPLVFLVEGDSSVLTTKQILCLLSFIPPPAKLSFKNMLLRI